MTLFPERRSWTSPARLSSGELGGNPGLTHRENLLEFGYGEILAAQEAEDAQAVVRVREPPERIYD